MKVKLPLGAGSSNLSVSYTVDFAGLLILGAGQTMLIAGFSALTQSTFNTARRNPLYRKLFSTAALMLTVQGAGWMFTALGGDVGVFDACTGQAARRRGARVLRAEHRSDGGRGRALDRAARLEGVAEQLPLDGAELLRRRGCGGRCGRRLGCRVGMAAPARGRAGLPDLPLLPRLPRSNCRGTAASRRDDAASQPDRRSAQDREGVRTALRPRGGGVERRPLGLGPGVGCFLRLGTLEADARPPRRSAARPRPRLVQPRACRGSRRVAHGPRSSPGR